MEKTRADYVFPREARPVGLQADSTFHLQSQSGKKKKKNKPRATRDDVGTRCENGGPLRLVKMSLRVTQQALP